MQVQSMGWEDPLEEGMATLSIILAWRIPWTKSLAGCSPQDRTESDTTEVTYHTCMHILFSDEIIWDKKGCFPSTWSPFTVFFFNNKKII